MSLAHKQQPEAIARAQASLKRLEKIEMGKLESSCWTIAISALSSPPAMAGSSGHAQADALREPTEAASQRAGGLMPFGTSTRAAFLGAPAYSDGTECDAPATSTPRRRRPCVVVLDNASIHIDRLVLQ